MSDVPDFVMRALIDDRLDQIRADKDAELEAYLAALPTPIHLIVDVDEIDDRVRSLCANVAKNQRQLLHHEVQADKCRKAIASDQNELTELHIRRSDLTRKATP